MSRLISDLLGASEPMFSMALKQLEDISGKPSVDVKLTAEIIDKVKTKTKKLGLDPKDTTCKELYYSLLAKLREDNVVFCNNLGCQNPNNLEELVHQILDRINKTNTNNKCWVLKKSVAKEMLKQNPPQKVMTLLNYKSISSMIKNEDIYELFGALRFVESPAWLARFNNNYKKIIPSDFEERDIEIYCMPAKRWTKSAKTFINKKRHNVTHLKELGAIIVLPTDQTKIDGLGLTIMALVLHYINEIRLYSSFFKLRQVSPDFTEIFSEILNNDNAHPAKLAGQEIHWRIIQRYWGKLDNQEKHPEIFEPHIQSEDLLWRKAEHTLSEIEPAFDWWKDLDYVGVTQDGAPVTFNMMDNVINLTNNFDFKDRQYYHFRESLWNELFIKYMGEKVFQKQILNQLDNSDIDPKTITQSLYKGGK